MAEGTDLHARFSASLADPDLPPPDGVTGPGGRPAGKRFDVYRNNVATSLGLALADIFPTTRRLIGDEAFFAVARLHVGIFPPSSPVLSEWGGDLAGHIETLEPLAELPFLSDVVRLERLWLDSYHAADGPVLDAESLGRIDPDRLAGLHVSLHPATRLLTSSHAIVSIVSRDRLGLALDGLDPSAPEIALVTRPDCDVMLSRVPEGVCLLLDAIGTGATLGDAFDHATARRPEADLSQALAIILQTGALSLPAEALS